MSKPMINKEEPEVVIRYMNWMAQMVDMIKPTNLYFIAGRGAAKTTNILAKRFKDISKEMPGAFVSVSADTYMNAIKNILPQIVSGWEMMGWIEGIHFVVDERPPDHFKKPYKSVLNWKHTVTTHHGTHFKIISQDRPSAGAGDSYQHTGGDESKYLKEKKLNKVAQASRGEAVRFQHSPYYLGATFTTDMPNPNLGENDWILNMEENMDWEQIKLILQVAFVLNEDKIKLVKKRKEIQKNPGDLELKKEEKNILKNIERWTEKYNKLRQGSTFFYVASSYINADILTEKYFKSQFEKYDFRELMTALLSIKPQVEVGEMFYPKLQEANFYSDGFIYSNIDKLTIKEIKDQEESCLDLKYLNTNAHIEAGFDPGNMCSLLVGQTTPSQIRVLKEFYTLAPDFIPELGEQFVNYFKYHKNKQLILYHDRAANNWKRVGQDHASKLKKAIEEKKDGTKTGWTVVLMNERQANIEQQTEYELMLEMLPGTNPKLPKLLIDKHNCPCYKSSMEKAKKIIKVKRTGEKEIKKDKSSEKLPLYKLPMDSTNMSDAGKYFLCRPDYLKAIEGNKTYFTGTPLIK